MANMRTQIVLNHPIKRGVNHIRLSTVTRHITLTVCRMQYFYYFKKQKQKRLTKRCRTTILKGFSYYNSIASSINPQILNLISSKLIKFVCDCDIKKEKKGEMEAIDSVFDPLREFAKDSVRLVKRCHKPDRKGIYLITNHIQNPPLCFFSDPMLDLEILDFSNS